MKVREISTNHAWDDTTKQKNVVVSIRATNSKTGKARRVVAPIKKRVDRILAAYKRMGNELKPDDFLFMNPLTMIEMLSVVKTTSHA